METQADDVALRTFRRTTTVSTIMATMNLSVDISESKAADRPRLLKKQATHFYHPAMGYSPMGGSTSWWRNQPSINGTTRVDL